LLFDYAHNLKTRKFCPGINHLFLPYSYRGIDHGGVTVSTTFTFWEDVMLRKDGLIFFWESANNCELMLPTAIITQTSSACFTLIGNAVFYCLMQGGTFPRRLDPLMFRERLGYAFDQESVFNYSTLVGKMACYAVFLYGEDDCVDLDKIPHMAEWLEQHGFNVRMYDSMPFRLY
jgi:hypothetical protein